ncbi:hypothetical protein GJ496_006777 [Pomphorhynchus laevis]|nr:hypothetical protein GJ496_006777 [Pomphorhynchus laevis]
MTIKCHEKFLQTLPVPIKIESSRVRRWHPKFDLELSTDDIRAASLPEINENVLNKPVNGQMLLEIGKTIRSQRMKRVLEKIASKRKHETLRKLSKFSSIDTSESGAIAKSISPERSPDNKKRSCIDLKVNKSTHLIDHHSVSVEDLNTVCKVTDPVLDNCVCENVLLNDFDRTKVHVNPHSSNKQSIIDARKAITESSKIKGLSDQLLLKIRQREEKNKIETLITSAPEFAEEQKISEVPKFVRTVRNYFLTEQRVAIPENKVRCKVMESLRDITSEIYDMCLETALREYSSWISRIPIRGIDYLKVRRNVDVNKLLSNLEKS